MRRLREVVSKALLNSNFSYCSLVTHIENHLIQDSRTGRVCFPLLKYIDNFWIFLSFIYLEINSRRTHTVIFLFFPSQTSPSNIFFIDNRNSPCSHRSKCKPMNKLCLKPKRIKLFEELWEKIIKLYLSC